MKKRIQFIINPISGIGKQKLIEPLLHEVLDKNLVDFEIKYTNAPHHATELSKQACLSGIDVVVAVGGDGSVNEVSKGILGSNSALAIIPAGSGNGLARHLGIPMDIRKSIELILKFNVTKIDRAEINGIHFINVAGIGFDAEVAHQFKTYGKRGFLSYVKLVLTSYAAAKEQRFSIYLNNQTSEEKALLISIANGSQFGNNAFISPDSKLDDGFLELCILSKIPLHAIPLFAYQLFTKKATQSKYLKIIRTKEMKLISENEKIHVDGEAVVTQKEMLVKLIPSSLNVLIP